jgi:hypothetical protein
MTSCVKCAAELAPDQTACPVCGAPIETAAPAPLPSLHPGGANAAIGGGGFRLSVRPTNRASAAAASTVPAAPPREPVSAETPPMAAAGGFVLVEPAAPNHFPHLVGPAEPEPARPAAPRSRFEELGFLFAKRRPPTIALVGMSNVGKTFFFTRLEHIAREEGMALRRRTQAGSVEFGVGARRPWEKDVQSTRETVVYSLGRSGKTGRDALWIIDMRGEVFREALEHHFRDARLEEVRDFWMILAAAQAYILMTPAADALHLGETPEEDALWDLSQGLEPMSAAIHLLERRIAATGDIPRAVGALSAMGPEELGDELDKPRPRCRKPVLMLLTQADVMLGEARRRLGEAGADLDADPMRVVAWRSRGLFRQLLEWFDYFKVDFVTACDGHDRDRTVMDVRKPSYGVWEAVGWARRMARRSGRRWTRRVWRTRYAVLYRRIIDKNFRDGLSRR